MKFYDLLIAALIATTACGGSGSDEPEAPQVSIKIEPTSISVDCEKAETQIKVVCSGEWSVYSSEEWTTVTKNRDNATADVKIAANNDEEARTAKITVKSGITTESITVTQAGRPIDVDPTIPTPEGYKLVWSDEFDVDGEPSGDWWYETGASGWGNNEIQDYVKVYTPNKTQIAVVEDGILKIKLVKEGDKVYSIRMNTSKAWTYGYLEARLKLPKGKGTWPAFWMMPKNYTTWPGDGEIDIMEEVGYNPNYVSSSIHCNAYNHMNGTQKTKEILVSGAQDEFHVYALEWTKDRIITYVDGKVLFSFDNDGKNNYDTWPFSNPFYLKLNLAWGGNWGGAQGIDESCLPATYEIDYVRVFQKK